MALDQSEAPAVRERLDELLLRWQELRQEGRSVAAADLCTDCPELETLLEEQIKAFAEVESILGIQTQEADGVKDESVINRTTLPPEGADATQVTGVSFHGMPSVPGYEIISVLGRGGMGVVYQARQVALNRMVALKMILSGGHASQQRLQRFRTEATAVARLQHPSVVQIHDIGELDGQPYYSMEFVAGGSLDQQLAKALMPPRQAAQLLMQIAQAMHHAHQNGIVHRDLKPANILLTGSKDSAPKIADFGVAKLLDEDGPSLSGEPMGTPSYMAPEQALGRKQDQGPAIDVYALGAILYEMLTGRPPFRGESTLDTLEQVCSREPVAPSQLQPGCPRDLETICLKCLRKEPGRRYPSAQELAFDLQRFLQDQPIEARPTPPWERVLKWMKRKPAVAVSLLLSAAAIIALLVVWIVFTAQLSRERDLARAAQGRAESKELEADSARKDAEAEKSTAEHERDLARKERERAEAMLERSLQLVEVVVRQIGDSKSRTFDDPVPGAILYHLAGQFVRSAEDEYAKAKRANSSGSGLSAADQLRLAEQYALQAVELLKRAQTAGYFRPVNNRRLVDTANEFAFLRIAHGEDFADARSAFEELATQVRKGSASSQ